MATQLQPPIVIIYQLIVDAVVIPSTSLADALIDRVATDVAVVVDVFGHCLCVVYLFGTVFRYRQLPPTSVQASVLTLMPGGRGRACFVWKLSCPGSFARPCLSTVLL